MSLALQNVSSVIEVMLLNWKIEGENCSGVWNQPSVCYVMGFHWVFYLKNDFEITVYPVYPFNNKTVSVWPEFPPSPCLFTSTVLLWKNTQLITQSDIHVAESSKHKSDYTTWRKCPVLECHSKIGTVSLNNPLKK